MFSEDANLKNIIDRSSVESMPTNPADVVG